MNAALGAQAPDLLSATYMTLHHSKCETQQLQNQMTFGLCIAAVQRSACLQREPHAETAYLGDVRNCFGLWLAVAFLV